MMFIGWEGVCLATYFIIGFRTENKTAGILAKKTFIIHRAGDFGLILGMLLLIGEFGTLNFAELNAMAASRLETGEINPGTLNYITLFLFLGACAKSAQLPFFTWLPDSTKGLIPGSAAIQSVTVVIAGVYLMARMSHLFVLSPVTMLLIATVGAITALFAATMGLVQNDVREILSFSSISQLGLVFIAIGIGAFSAGIFLLMAHAFIKSVLFLGAGSKMDEIGNEGEIQTLTSPIPKFSLVWFVLFIGTWAMVGMPFGAGFFSHQAILLKSLHSPYGYGFLWFLGFLSLGITSFYMWRLMILASRSGGTHNPNRKRGESSWLIKVPLMVLVILAAFSGLFGIPQVFLPFSIPNFTEVYFQGFFPKIVDVARVETNPNLELVLMIAPAGLVLGGWFFARKIYFPPTDIPQKLAKKYSRIYHLLLNKYYVDGTIEKILIQPINWICTNFLWKGFELRFIDGIVKLIGYLVSLTGTSLKFLQTGNLQHYGMIFVLAIIGIVSYFL